MPQIDWLALIPFVFITNFTPGPNVIPAMSLGVIYGLRKAMHFCAGVLVGYVFLMLASAFVASALFSAFPAFETGLRVIGAIYIAYLAFTTLRKSFQIEINDHPMYGFWQGLLMQFVNIKGMLFGLTLFSTFLAPLQMRVIWQVVAAVGIAISAFSAAATYALFGSAIRQYLANDRIRRVISIILSVLLLITALRVLGLFDWLQDAVV